MLIVRQAVKRIGPRGKRPIRSLNYGLASTSKGKSDYILPSSVGFNRRRVSPAYVVDRVYALRAGRAEDSLGMHWQTGCTCEGEGSRRSAERLGAS
jgi:hypothetical protein